MNVFCRNKELEKEYLAKEGLLSKVSEKVTKCPKCKEGHFVYENDNWYQCDSCGFSASLNRTNLLDYFCFDDWWDYPIFEVQDIAHKEINDEHWGEELTTEQVEEAYLEYKKTRSDTYNTYQEFVENLIKEHTKSLDKMLDHAKTVKMLRRIV